MCIPFGWSSSLCAITTAVSTPRKVFSEEAFTSLSVCNVHFKMRPVAATALCLTAGQPVVGGKHNSGGCCNIQWVLFAFGWVTGIAWIFGLLAPLCNTQRLKNSSYK